MNDYPTADVTNTNTQKSAPLVAIYWLIVALPLGWGVYQTVQKSLPLFHATANAPATAAPPGAAVTPPQP